MTVLQAVLDIDPPTDLCACVFLSLQGKEFETRLKEKKPGDLSDELRIALGMPVGPVSSSNALISCAFPELKHKKLQPPRTHIHTVDFGNCEVPPMPRMYQLLCFVVVCLIVSVLSFLWLCHFPYYLIVQLLLLLLLNVRMAVKISPVRQAMTSFI